MRSREEIKEMISAGQAVLGIELGSTRIKAVLIDVDKTPVASGSYDWENRYVDHIWTYNVEDIWQGLQGCYRDLVKNVEEEYGEKPVRFAAMGISAMMHGYLAFDENDELLVPFRTWRNTITGEASEKLSELFAYHIPQRWSIAHLYQAILNGEEHIPKVRFFTTLAGYIHWKLSARRDQVIVREYAVAGGSAVPVRMRWAGTPEEISGKLSRLLGLLEGLRREDLPFALRVQLPDGEELAAGSMEETEAVLWDLLARPCPTAQTEGNFAEDSLPEQWLEAEKDAIVLYRDGVPEEVLS